MGSLGHARRLQAWRWISRAPLAAAVFFAATCSDQPPVAPRTLAPGHAAFALRPTFAVLPPGGPSIPLTALRAVLRAANGDTVTTQVPFVGDSAVLTLEVQISGSSGVFSLTLTALDAQGNVVYSTSRDLTLHPGENPPPELPPLEYAGPDAGVASVHISPSSVTLAAHGSATLTATGTDASGQPVASLRVGWSSKDPSIASVDDNGNVTAGASQGSTMIVARSANGAGDSITVQVHAPVDHIVVAPTSLSLAVGKTGAVGAELRDETGHLIDDRAATWTSSDPSVATVTATGTVTAVKIGTATLTAAAEGKSATVAVTVTSPIDHIELTPNPLQFSSFKQSISLVTMVVPVAGASIDGLVPTFSSSAPAVVTVDAKGVVTSVANGTAKITASIGGVSASVDATVHQVAASVTVSPDTVRVTSIGDAQVLRASAADAQGNKIDSAKVTWASGDPNIASVAGSGPAVVVQGLRVGTTQITATVDGKAGSAKFVVAPVPASLIMSANPPQVTVGSSTTLTAQFVDANGNAYTDVFATFSLSETSVASLSGNRLTGLSVGTAFVSATAGGFTDSLAISVVPGPPEMVVLGDMEMLNDVGGGLSGSAQFEFVSNIINFQRSGPRAGAVWVEFYRGHNSSCASLGSCSDSSMSGTLATVEENGHPWFTWNDTSSGPPLDSGIDPQVYVIFLLTPTTPFSTNEINSLKQFAAEGGRIVFVGDDGSHYGAQAVENQLLAALGSPLRAINGDVACPGPLLLPESAIRSSAITSGVMTLGVACSSTLAAGAGDIPILYDPSNAYVIGAVTHVDISGTSVPSLGIRPAKTRRVLPRKPRP